MAAGENCLPRRRFAAGQTNTVVGCTEQFRQPTVGLLLQLLELDQFAAHGRRIVSPHSAILLFPLHGRLSDLPEDHSAVGNRKTATVFNIAGSWDDPSDDDANIGWARDAWEDMSRFSTGGTYVNFLTEEEGDSRIHDAYGDNYARLASIKQRYDPGNVFRTNKNILPR